MDLDMKWACVPILVVTSACASTGYVPRPFPLPNRPAIESTPHVPAAGPGDMYALVGTALSLRGAPYRNGGSDPSGFDCSGFTQYVFGQHGLPLAREVREQYRQGAVVDPRDLAPGDLVFFSTTDPGASHVAIVVGGDEFVHAPSTTGVVRVERLGARYWSERFIGARRVTAATTTSQ